MSVAGSEIAARVPKWGPAVHGDGFLALLQHKEPGIIEYTAEEHGLVIGLSPIARREVRIGGTHTAHFKAPVGAITIIPHTADHRSSWSDVKECVFVAFTPARLRAIARDSFDVADLELYPVGDGRSDPLLLNYARLLEREMRSCAQLRELCVESVSLLIVAHLLRHYSSVGTRPLRPIATGGLAPRARQEVRDYLDAHCCEPLTVSELARVARLAPSSFMRSFRQEFGVSVRQFILRLRIEKADALLGRDELDIASIALATGFSSQSHFTTTYRRIRGNTPARSRRSL